jgi:hypothetical protein
MLKVKAGSPPGGEPHTTCLPSPSSASPISPAHLCVPSRRLQGRAQNRQKLQPDLGAGGSLRAGLVFSFPLIKAVELLVPTEMRDQQRALGHELPVPKQSPSSAPLNHCNYVIGVCASLLFPNLTPTIPPHCLEHRLCVLSP